MRSFAMMGASLAYAATMALLAILSSPHAHPPPIASSTSNYRHGQIALIKVGIRMVLPASPGGIKGYQIA